MTTALANGLIAGAAGTTALNAATYADMAVRGRGSSSTPEKTVERGAQAIGVSVPGDDQTKQARDSGLGSLLGIAAGVGTGVALGVVRRSGWPRGQWSTSAVALGLVMVAGNAPMTVLGVSDPTTWSAKSWAADIVPHAVYALTAAATFQWVESSR